MPVNKYKIVITETAKEELQEIFDYISSVLYAPMAAAKLIDEIKVAFKKIQRFPFSGSTIGKKYLEFSDYRKYIVKNYNIYYTVRDNEVIIMNVMHQSRSYERL